MTNAECGMNTVRSGECGVRSREWSGLNQFGVWSSEFGMGEDGRETIRMRNAECGMDKTDGTFLQPSYQKPQ